MLVATLTPTTDAANSGYYFQAIIGDPPAATHASASHFAQAASVFGALASGVSLAAEANAPPFTPLMSIAKPIDRA